ncbi:hypothetical protein LWP59_26995 [Amycolatopsis acidiphila]|uniref:hypothetical protein n=1 Tax=Amycolatopsis acidiphila TaxID=715473 RepID=UPI001643F9C0|nr:hypothetical protein [Amycolatopsis acidiphila]UIJ57773.1 hypothetical protein LWP59_26995 [Amycolatopsis acidiphila]GHG87620.1 hypothetical protein GCM10017788_61380 [Amycolatopsis acidiphila]
MLTDDLPDPDCTATDLVRATGFTAAALEIVDSRITDWDISIVDTVADNAPSGLFVLGGTRVPPDRVDLRTVRMTLSRHGTVVSEGSGADCLVLQPHFVMLVLSSLVVAGFRAMLVASPPV